MGWVKNRLFGTIRNKIIVPFFLLTVSVAMLGTFVVTRLVAASVQDRLTTQLLEGTRIANDRFVAYEERHLQFLELVVFSVGVPEALVTEDAETLSDQFTALAANQNAYILLGINPQGSVIQGVRQGNDSSYQTDILIGENLGDNSAIEMAIRGEEDEFGDKYATIIDLNGDLVLLTAAPVIQNEDEVIGVIATGTPLNDILREIKGDVLADLVVYNDTGSVVATTFNLFQSADDQTLEIPIALYHYTLQANYEEAPIREMTLNRRDYQVAYSPLSIRSEKLGVLGVLWTTSAVTSVITTNRVGLSIAFAIVASLVIVIGYVVANQLSHPIRHLAYSAEKVSSGDLSHRSNVKSSDEIGTLGRVFDEMTSKLEAQTLALQMAFKEQEREAARLSAILSSIADGTVVIGEDDKITHYNPIAQELISKNEASWKEILDDISQAASKDNPAHQRVNMGQNWFDVTAAPVVTTTDQEVGVVVTVHDVSDQVLNERMRTAFILQMSHELFTPLTAFKGYTELAALSVDEEPQSTFLNKAMDSAGVLNRMIIQMLDVAQMVGGEFQIQREKADVGKIVEEVINSLSHLFKMKELQIKTNVSVGKHRVASEELRWALFHLIQNAVNYTPAEGKIKIEAREINNEIVIRVHDTGVGIAKSDQPKIFDLFYRGRPVTRDGEEIDVRGTGLGLFVARNVIRQHGGSLTFTSEEFEGTEFVARLPIDETPQEVSKQVLPTRTEIKQDTS